MHLFEMISLPCMVTMCTGTDGLDVLRPALSVHNEVCNQSSIFFVFCCLEIFRCFWFIGTHDARWGARRNVPQDFMAVNLAHGQLRRRLVTPDKMSLVEETIGKQGADRFLDSGITGVTAGKVRTRHQRPCDGCPIN